MNMRGKYVASNPEDITLYVIIPWTEEDIKQLFELKNFNWNHVSSLDPSNREFQDLFNKAVFPNISSAAMPFYNTQITCGTETY